MSIDLEVAGPDLGAREAKARLEAAGRLVAHILTGRLPADETTIAAVLALIDAANGFAELGKAA